jgi:phytoene dehydrogenase-like protein
MIAMIMSYFKLGAYRSYGGFQVLSDRLVEGIRAKGGEVFFGRRVERILMSRDGLCQGVRCENGETYMADNVVSNADYARTFTTLLGDAYSAIPDAMNRAAGVSTSFFVVYAGINGDVPLPSSVGHFPSYDMESFFRPEMELCEDSTIGLTIASIEDPARAPHGCHTVVLHEMMKKKLCARDREQYTELVLNKAEKIIPGISGRICTIETATPQTFERYTDNNRGAAFGWQQVPGFRGTKRYGIRNLHIAGHWGDFGGGVLGAAYSGAKAASTILSRKGIPHAL